MIVLLWCTPSATDEHRERLQPIQYENEHRYILHRLDVVVTDLCRVLGVSQCEATRHESTYHFLGLLEDASWCRAQ